MKLSGKLIISILGTLCISSAWSDPSTVINNNNYNQAPNTSSQGTANQSNCNQPSASYGTGLPPGTYNRPHGDGSSDEIYTTGDKQPYIVDNNCNSNQGIQPYVYVQPPFVGPAPGPVGPGPIGPGQVHPMPRR